MKQASKANNIYNFIFFNDFKKYLFSNNMFLSNIEFNFLGPIFNSFRAKVVLLKFWTSINFDLIVRLI